MSQYICSLSGGPGANKRVYCELPHSTAGQTFELLRPGRHDYCRCVLIGLLLALGCSVCYGTATVLQAAATRRVAAGSDSGVDAALLLRALQQWRYLAGLGLDGVGFLLQVAALRLVPI